jgi:hypothetical protein
MKALADREEVPLEYAARRIMSEKDRALRELDEEEDEEEVSSRRRKKNDRDDVVLDEAFKVLMDLIRLTKGEELPKPKGWWF